MRFYSVTAAIFLSAADAYAQTAAPGGTPLRLAPTSEAPKYQALVPGLFGRSVYRAQSPDRSYSVEVLGLLIGPGQSSEPTKFDGDAVLLVRSGQGVMDIEGKSQELSLGRSFSVTAGQTFRIENLDQTNPISLRAVILRSTR